MDRRFWVIIGVIVVLFFGLVVLNGKKEDKQNTDKNNGATTTQHLRGKIGGKVTLVEYGDFQCPVCGTYEPAVVQALEKNKDVVQFQFRNYPLSQIHQNAFAAARAAEAADMQGKYWEMHDALFQAQQAWSSSTSASSTFETYASQLGLDVAKFRTDFASSTVNDRINADRAAFDKLGLRKATPTFLLNGKQITPDDPEQLIKMVDDAVKNTK